MDYQNRVGSKKGGMLIFLSVLLFCFFGVTSSDKLFIGGGEASWSQANASRRKRLQELALEHIDLAKDPYIFKNHLGFFECKLCLTTHVTDGSYLSHTQGRKHQMNLARREAKEREHRKTEIDLSGTIQAQQNANQPKRNIIKIGRPGYKITKIRDPVTRQAGLLFQLEYPEIALDVVPRYRFMSAFEQKVETPADRRFQYLVVAAEPYESCGFKIDAKELDQRPGRLWTYFDKDTKAYYLQLFFKNDSQYNKLKKATSSLPPIPGVNNNRKKN